MAALATSSDVEASLGRSLTSTEDSRVERLLDGASFLARRVARRPFAAGDYTVTRIVREDRVQVPETSTVTEVRGINEWDGTTTELADVTTNGRTIFGLSAYRRVEVDFTVATDYEVPADVVGAVADMVADVFRAPAESSVQSQSTGPFSVTYRTGAGTVVAQGVALATLKAYRPSVSAAINLL